VLTEEQETKARVFFCGTMKTHFDNNGSISPIGVKSPSGMVSSTPNFHRSILLTGVQGVFPDSDKKMRKKNVIEIAGSAANGRLNVLDQISVI